MARVSIIVPTYNSELFIENCVRSAMAQSYSDIEIVVVDNCSTDNTISICERLRQEDDRILIFQNSANLGPVRNWQKGVGHSTGLYAKILFSDDMLGETCIEDMLTVFDETNSDQIGFVYSAALVGPNVETATKFFSDGRDEIFRSEVFVNQLVYGNAPKSPCAILLRRSDLLRSLNWAHDQKDKDSLLGNGAGPDVMIMLLQVLSYKKVAVLDRALVFFRAHDGSLTINNANHAVTQGYTKVISSFLNSSSNQKNYVTFLTRIWVIDLLRGRTRVLLQGTMRRYDIQLSIAQRALSVLILPKIVVAVLSVALRRSKRGSRSERLSFPDEQPGI